MAGRQTFTMIKPDAVENNHIGAILQKINEAGFKILALKYTRLSAETAGKFYAKCIMDFENRIKSDFRNNGQKWAVDVGIEAEFPEAGIEEGYMTFTNEEILQCFEPVVNRILELVRNQIIAIQAQNRTLQVKILNHSTLLR